MTTALLHPSAARRLLAVIAMGLGCTAALADVDAVSSQVRVYWSDKTTASDGPIAMANQLQSGTAAINTGERVLQWEIAGDQKMGSTTWHASATLQTQLLASDATRSRAWLNEVYATDSALDWEWTVGKKVVSWDVGYGFRPNDVVQQEARRSLAFEPLTGRPVVMAEHFTADTAWSAVWVEPGSAMSDSTKTPEPAFAARWYRRAGAVDWHGFFRHGQQTGTSLGWAAAWVASDALELHASVRTYQHVVTIITHVPDQAIANNNPWQTALSGGGQQFLLGASWTFENQVSLMLEAWHDDAALSDSQWDDWKERNQALAQWARLGASAGAVAGNLAWQANAFGVASNLRQDNVFARLAWQHDRWTLAWDILLTPADHGVITTASAGWTGERVKLDLGVRANRGPGDAVVRQLPTQAQAYILASWAF